ncbi:EI24 domain-containing protein [Viridibacterium curvum]|uniref:EI24 domain-containing protein n=1 Tax=Viridibacterium curvum TaxID=1101404 RepID=A0ABP9R119_9RHOO
MDSIFVALARAARSLTRGHILWHLLWPTLLAFAIWIAVGIALWSESAALLLDYVQAWPAVGKWFADGSALALALGAAAHLLLVLLFLPLSLITATVLISVFAVPLMLDRVAASDYPDLARRNGGSQIGSITNAILSLVIFIVLALLSLPLWLIPGMGLVLSVALGAWLNQRCYRYDALMQHADVRELSELPRRHRGKLWLLGIGAGVLVYVPFLNFFVPAITGLAFVHYLLQALREARKTEHIIDVN